MDFNTDYILNPYAKKAMEDLIDRIEQDLPNYVIDVLVETDEYQNYIESVN